MKRSKQETKVLFVNRSLTVVCFFLIMAACGLAMAVSPAFASPQEMGKPSAEDIMKESKGSPAGGKVN